jgi:hypothetical protein
MEVKIDINDTIQKAIGVMTKFGDFWKGITLPSNIGPALSYLIIIGLVAFVGNLLAGIVPVQVFGVWVSRGVTYGLVYAVLGYAFFVGMPILMGIILAAIDPALNINKAKAPEYTTVLAYAATPAAVGALLSFIPWLGWLLALCLWMMSLIITYLAFTEGIGMESGQAIIMMVIMAIITMIIYLVIFTVIMGAIFSMGMGMGGFNPYM